MNKLVTAPLDDELFARLTRFVQASGTYKTRVIRAAIDEFITKALREDINIRERYERYEREDKDSAARRAGRNIKPILKVVK